MKSRREIFDLGLAVSGATMREGEVRTCHDLKCFVDAAFEVMGVSGGVSAQRIDQITQRGLRKLRHPERIRKLR